MIRALPDLLTFASAETIERFCGFDSLESKVHHYERDKDSFIAAIDRWSTAEWVSIDSENNVTFETGRARLDSIVSGCYVDRTGAGGPRLVTGILQLPG